jgi:CheY-like chemotaxis protein
VELMGGSASVSSKAGTGSRFVITVPIESAEAPPETSLMQSLPDLARAIRVLVAEDNTTNQVVAFGMLRKLGFGDVSLAGDGAQAYEMAMATRFDVILMDCQMPEMDGYEATRRLRAAGCKAVIVAMTANAIKGDREKCLAAGMDDYLTKPMDLKVLNTVLARWTIKPAPAQPTDSGFDALVERFGGDIELANAAIGAFHQSTPALLTRLEAACRNEDRRLIGLAAHSAKGSGAMVCADRYAAIAGEIEDSAADADIDHLGRLVRDLQQAFTQLQLGVGSGA